MPAYYVTDYGTAKIVADRMDLSAKQVDTLGGVFDKMKADIMKNTKEQIKSQGRRAGTPWEPLAYETWLKKGSGRLLYTMGSKRSYDKIDHNALVDSVTVPGAMYQISSTNKTGFTFGTRRPYAYVHQHGSRARNIPARPFLAVLPQDVAKWDGWIAEHLLKPFSGPVKPKGAP